MIKVLLDTDIGTDVDDAVCLAYLLSQPECDLVGITTVTGEADQRAALASVLCKVAGRSIPIFPGAETPLNAPQRQVRAQQATALPRWPHASNFPRDQAVPFMQRKIRDNPGEVVLLTVGPLTNIGQLFLADPEIPQLLKGLVMMGGVYNPYSPEWERIEWNTSGDPQATEIVFRAPLRLHRALGLEVTQRVMLSADEVRTSFTAPLLQPVLDFAEIWFAEFFPSITFHDPLAAATLFDPGVCTFQRGAVTVDMDERPGRTYFKPGDLTAPHDVAVSVDVPRYFEHFFGVFK